MPSLSFNRRYKDQPDSALKRFNQASEELVLMAVRSLGVRFVLEVKDHTSGSSFEVLGNVQAIGELLKLLTKARLAGLVVDTWEMDEWVQLCECDSYRWYQIRWRGESRHKVESKHAALVAETQERIGTQRQRAGGM